MSAPRRGMGRPAEPVRLMRRAPAWLLAAVLSAAACAQGGGMPAAPESSAGATVRIQARSACF